jgi:hypothetical protein
MEPSGLERLVDVSPPGLSRANDGQEHAVHWGSGLLTTAFVNRAKGLSRRHHEPLLLRADVRPEETLYLNSGFSEYAKWRVSLGPIDVLAPPPPTWREQLRDLGVSLETDDDVRRACDERGLELQDLDRRVDAFGWEDRWDNFTGPQARAHYLL